MNIILLLLSSVFWFFRMYFLLILLSNSVVVVVRVSEKNCKICHPGTSSVSLNSLCENHVVHSSSQSHICSPWYQSKCVHCAWLMPVHYWSFGMAGENQIKNKKRHSQEKTCTTDLDTDQCACLYTCSATLLQE